ncbi:MAG TPA: PTS sugar transporter subunit IIB [Erysipelotrichaceae bacterium]|nr:PTS sugar transporter subunit IIB [Erysipelotrichaceae bacterium]HQB31992.1 PTS sugar transporter subunit IIB [Erysipelotrichaceae bacterium]
MAIKLVRIDFRLIHGQVITKWVRTVGANLILIVNDDLFNDKFMFDIYKMSAPTGIKVDVMTKDAFADAWKTNQFESDNVMILLKSVKDAYYLYKQDVVFDELQIGGLGGGPGRKVVFGPITLDKTDVEQLDEISNSNTKVYFHQVPEDPSADYQKIIIKHNF